MIEGGNHLHAATVTAATAGHTLAPRRDQTPAGQAAAVLHGVRGVDHTATAAVAVVTPAGVIPVVGVESRAALVPRAKFHRAALPF